MEPIHRHLAGRAAALTGAALLSACVASPPDRASWRDDGARALSDVASQVATVQLVLEQEADDRLLGGYAVVMASHAEDTAGSSADGFAARQPPREERKRYHALVDALDRATGLLADARIAIADHDEAAYPHLVRRLDRVGARLDRLERGLS